MRKFLTTGLFGAILGIVIGGAPADAALISRSFLDQALTDYATNTALDLKANQSDFTELSNKIGTLPTAMEFYEYDANGTLGRTKYPTADVFGINDNIGGMLTAILQGFGDSSGHIVLSLPEISTRTVRLSDQIGTLPDGITVQGMYEGWTDKGGHYLPGLYNLSKGETLLLNAYNNSGSALLLLQGAKATTIDGVDYTGPVYPLWKLSEGIDKIDSIETKIGTLPDGYETVGAALTAIKGIAEEAKTAALAAIPDPKAEGSTGKFVLTVDIVGDNATYRWEKIDREGEATTTTE